MEFIDCASCNCFPGSCARKDRVPAELARESVANVLSGEAGYRIEADGPLVFKPPPVPVAKNRKQRRFEARLARRGPQVKPRH